LSPLTGFMGKEDYDRVVQEMRLRNGLVWSLPVTLAVTEDEASGIGQGQDIAL
jgi:sulfate adenylyltransferase